MKEKIKKYFTHILSVFFLIYVNILFYLINHNSILQGKEYIYVILIILEMLLVFGIIGEIIYFLILVAKDKKLKSNPLYYVLIYMLNIFYIPCFVLKHIKKDKNYKKKNIIYLVISILLYILLTVNIMSFTSLEQENKYISNDSNVSVYLNNDYVQKIVGDYDMYFSNNTVNIGIFLYDDGEKADDILNYQARYLLNTRDAVRKISSSSKKIKDRKITTTVYRGTIDNNENIYMLSTITSEKDKNYVIYVIEITLAEDYQENKDEMEKIVEKISYNQ